MESPKFYVITGGTTVAVAPHFSLAAPAYGHVGAEIARRLTALLGDDGAVVLVQTRMAQGSQPVDGVQAKLLDDARLDQLETNADLAQLVDHIVERPDTRCIVLAAAVCDFEPVQLSWGSGPGAQQRSRFGRDVPRLRSRAGQVALTLRASDKLIGRIRRERKDIFVVGFKAMAGVSERELYSAGLRLLKTASLNLVLANDIQARRNLVITPEEYPYAGDNREHAIQTLVEMIRDRTRLTFVRTLVRDELPADPLALHDAGAIPANFVPVLRHLIARGAYKPFLAKTSGHFGCKVLDPALPFQRIASIRKVDHNAALRAGMAKIYGIEAGQIIAGGGRPSVGEHTQHSIYEALGDAVHSIVHFHCPPRPDASVPRAPQRAFECGSVECGLNTSLHLERVRDGIHAVHLDGHGPNIAFHRDVPVAELITWIDEHFDLADKTGGLLPASDGPG